MPSISVASPSVILPSFWILIQRIQMHWIISAYETQIQSFCSWIWNKIWSPYPDRRTEAELLAVDRITMAMGKGVLLIYVELWKKITVSGLYHKIQSGDCKSDHLSVWRPGRRALRFYAISVSTICNALPGSCRIVNWYWNRRICSKKMEVTTTL